MCAICLGLGGSPKSLGRSDSISSFVRSDAGAKMATIAITLSHSSAGDTTITRRITLEGGTDWTISSRQNEIKHASANQIKTLVAGCGIDVDNLCQLLAQDRVVELSRMSAPQLLIETEV